MNEELKSAAAFVILILSGFSAPRCDATVHDSDGSAASVQALHNAARDGDTITIPTGTFTWSTGITITKGITLRGQTTITGAGTASPTANDLTIIKDNLPVGSSAITARMRSATQSFRLTGITFTYGSRTTFGSTDGFIHLICRAAQPNQSMRIDHCHFASLYQGKMIWISGWVYGVADHNVIQCRPRSFSFNINHPTWGGPSQTNGNGSWADYPWYGTEKFWFIEDNTIIGTATGGRISGTIDTQHGGRWVARHNYFQNAIPSGHGTEGGAHRGQRVNEFYDNTVHWTIPWNGGGQRSGTSLWHDNTFTGVESTGGRLVALANYRQTPARAFPIWGISDGTSVWDQNDTDGNGHSVEGQPPHLFDSGTATANGRWDGKIGTLIDNTKNWTPNQWVGYSIKNTKPASASYSLGSYIISNTSDTITYCYYGAPDTRGHLVFNAGDTYEIHRVLVMMDQNGRGKGDLVINPNPVNTATGRRSWPHQALEPCYSWNNVHTPTGHSYGFNVAPGQPTTKPGIDFFNLGAGFPIHTTPSEVSSTYTAALNGVAYTGTFVYPHPLVSGAPTPTPSATPSSSPHSPQRKENKVKKGKKKKPKKIQENSANETAQRLPRRSRFVNPRRCSHGALRRLDIRAPNDAKRASQGRSYNIC
jgi:hypothetical protein